MKWSNEDLEYLKNNFYIDKNILILKLKKSINSINRMIRRLDLIEKKNLIWSDYEIDILKEKYPKEKIEDFIYLLNNRNKNQVMLKANKLKIKKEIKNSDNTKRYTLLENYFQEIDTFNKAYYLGWAFTDGNVNFKKSGYQYRLRLNEKDIEILENFLKEIGSNTLIYNRKNNCEVNICSKTFVTHLYNLGCVNNKTFVIEFPKIQEEYELDFIKGCFDGDGCYCISKKRNSASIFSASYNFVLSIKKILEKYNVYGNIYKSGKHFNFVIAKNQDIKNFLFLMLNTKSDFLQRKKDKMIKILESKSHK